MAHFETQSKVGADGSLILNLPLGIFKTDREVKITVDSLPESQEISVSDWDKRIEDTAGKWEGEPLTRAEQGEVEQRNEWIRSIFSIRTHGFLI